VISREAIEEAIRRGLLGFVRHRSSGCWRFGDARNGCLRRLDGQPFKINGQRVKAKAETQGECWHRLIGLDDVVTNNRRNILLTLEGSKDALAAFHFADAEGTLPYLGVVAGLGTGINLLAEDVEVFLRRRVRIIPDVDQAGMQTAMRISQQLLPVAADVQILNLAGLKRDGGSPVKDLFDLTRIDVDDFERERDLWSITNLGSLGPRVRIVEQTPGFFSSPTNNARLLANTTGCHHTVSVTKDNQRSTNDDQGWEREETEKTSIATLLEIANSLACREKGKGHRAQFQLARQVRHFEEKNGLLNNQELRLINRRWFSASTALPANATEPEAFSELIERLRKVRIIPGSAGGR
jgi:hypothetical protein